jgi:hypothetical protein
MTTNIGALPDERADIFDILHQIISFVNISALFSIIFTNSMVQSSLEAVIQLDKKHPAVLKLKYPVPFTEHHTPVLSTPASYSQGAGFKSRLGEWLS